MWPSKGALSTPIFSSVGEREEGDTASQWNSWALMQEQCSGPTNKYRTYVFTAVRKVSAAPTLESL
jgi:hypothetical protein